MRDNKAEMIIKTGFIAGVKTWWWLTKMTFAITFLVTLLKWSGYLVALSEFLGPVLCHVGIDTEGALVFLTGALANIYSSIAVMGTFNFSIRTAAIIAVMNLICHNIIIETIVQYKVGNNPIKISVLRVFTAVFCAWILNMILPMDMPGTILLHTEANPSTSIWSYISDWLVQMSKIIPLMFCIIVLLNIFQTFIREYGWINYFSKPMKPLMMSFGLHEECSFLWIVLNTLGLTYGASVMISNANNLEKEHLKLLNTHAAITHSLLEDTLVYVAIGIPVIILIIPRLTLSFFVVWAERLIIHFKSPKFGK